MELENINVLHGPHPASYIESYLGDLSQSGVIFTTEAGETPVIAFKVQDRFEAAEAHRQGGPPVQERTTGLKAYFLTIEDARIMTVHLLHALAKAGDRVALELSKQIKPAIQAAAAAEGKPDPYGERVDNGNGV